MWLFQHQGLFYGFSATASTEAVGFAASRAALLDAHPYLRTWRSTSLTAPFYRADLGGANLVQGVGLFNTNFAAVLIECSNSPTTGYTTVYDGPVSRHPLTYLRQLFVTTNQTRQYWRVTPSAVDGASYYEFGQLVLLAQYNLLSRAPRPGMGEDVESPFLQSGAEVAEYGLRGRTQHWTFRYARSDTDGLLAIYDLVRMPRPFIVLVSENHPTTNWEVGLFRRVGVSEVTRQGDTPHAYHEFRLTYAEMNT
jgi:hypothetical protein